MVKQKILGLAVWMVGLALCHVFLWMLPGEKNNAAVLTEVFIWIAFVSQLVLWLRIWKKPKTAEEQFLLTPLLFFSGFYLAGEMVLCLVFGFWAASLSLTAIVNVVWSLLMAAVLAFSLIGQGHAEKMHRRQKDHHKKL